MVKVRVCLHTKIIQLVLEKVLPPPSPTSTVPLQYSHPLTPTAPAGPLQHSSSYTHSICLQCSHTLAPTAFVRQLQYSHPLTPTAFVRPLHTLIVFQPQHLQDHSIVSSSNTHRIYSTLVNPLSSQLTILFWWSNMSDTKVPNDFHTKKKINK